MRVRHIAEIAILTAVYVVTAQLSYEFHVVSVFESLIWVPTGIAFAAVLLLGNRMALGMVFGVAIAMSWSNRSPIAGIAVGAVEALAAVGAGYVLRRAFGFCLTLGRVRDVLAFVATSFVTSLATALAGTGILVVAGMVEPHRVASAVTNWWWGYLAGNLIVTPLVITWGTRATGDTERRAPLAEIIAFGLGVLAVCAYVFYDWFPEWLPGSRMPYLLVVFLLWAGLRFGPRGATAASFAISATAIAATVARVGPFAHLPHYLQVFVSISALMTLVLAALEVERLGAVRRKGAILSAALDAIVTIDRDHRIVEFNPAAERLFGVPASEAIGRDVVPLIVPPSLHTGFRADLAGYLRTGASALLGRRERFPLRRADGSEFQAEVAAMRIPIEGEYLFTGFIRDVTAESAAEDVLLESRRLLEERVRERTTELVAANQELERRDELLRESQALAHLGSFERDLEHARLEWSDEMYRIYGREPATFDPNESFLSCIHPDDRARVGALVARSRTVPEPFSFEMRIVRPDGEIRVLHSRGKVHVDEAGRALRVTGYSQDITERKRAEEARYRLGEIVESSHDAIIGLSRDGVIETWNRAAEQIFGYSVAEVTGREATLLVPHDHVDTLEQMLESVRAGRHLGHYNLVHARRDGTRFEASVTTSAIRDREDRVIGMSKVVRDISDQKEAENKLRAALGEKEVLLREIHHRVKNNLQVISSLLNLQVANVPSEEARKRLIESQGRIQSIALVHQLLYRSKDLAHIDLLEYLQSLVLRLGKTYSVESDHPVTATVRAPNTRLDIDCAIPCGLIVNELVTNAFNHAFPDGRRGHVAVTLTHEGRQLVLEVGDDGIGMSPNIDIDTAQTLGLQIVRTLAHQLAGRIELVRDRGTTVRVVFPFTAWHIAADREVEPMIRGLRILVADDDLDLLRTLIDTLERAGATVTRARNGAELIEALGEQGPFDLIVTDVAMPWMTGLQAIQSTRYAGLATPVIVMTALKDTTIPERVGALGATATLLRKPFELAELEAAVEKVARPAS